MIKFQDDNFKLACLDALFLKGLLKEELQEGLSINPEFNEYDVNKPRLEYFQNIEITQEDLDSITSFAPQGDDDIYTYVYPYWSGEEEELYLRDFRDLPLLRNLEDLWINAITVEHSFDLVNVLALHKLKRLDSDKFYVDHSTLKDCLEKIDSQIEVIIH